MRLDVDPAGSEAPFEQVRRQIAEGAADGSLPAGHRLPTVRALATELGLAANTVAKAYRALESDGVIETRGRHGTFVASRHAPDAATTDAARTYALLARRDGLSKDEALRLVDQHWT
ncbi:MAG: GntR family transcriptional regulator [Aeromicrobium sp.]|nr:GntR family transcriptional regulator [Aeromicrobium sp.]